MDMGGSEVFDKNYKWNVRQYVWATVAWLSLKHRLEATSYTSLFKTRPRKYG